VGCIDTLGGPAGRVFETPGLTHYFSSYSLGLQFFAKNAARKMLVKLTSDLVLTSKFEIKMQNRPIFEK
jgi:hypothetical protein